MTYPSFSVGDVLAASDMNAVGLWKITPTVSGTGLTVSNGHAVLTNMTTGGEIRSVFSSSFRHYKVILSHTCSTTLSVDLQMLSGTNTPETGLVYRIAAVGYVTDNTAYNAAFPASGSFQTFSQGGASDGGTSYTTAEFFTPNIASRTMIKTSNALEWLSNTVYMREYGCLVDTATQYTGFRLNINTGNITGTIQIYGYN